MKSFLLFLCWKDTIQVKWATSEMVVCVNQACTWDPKHPFWCSTTSFSKKKGLPHVQALPTTGVVSPGVCFCSPYRSPATIVQVWPQGQPNAPRPTTAQSSVKLRIVRKHLMRVKVHLKWGGRKAHACTETAATITSVSEAWSDLCYIVLLKWRNK